LPLLGRIIGGPRMIAGGGNVPLPSRAHGREGTELAWK
jgi:hypothetical protein